MKNHTPSVIGGLALAVENGKCVSVKVLLGGYAVIPWMPKCYA